LKNIKDVDKKICEIGGSYFGELTFDNKPYWNINTSKPAR